MCNLHSTNIVIFATFLLFFFDSLRTDIMPDLEARLRTLSLYIAQLPDNLPVDSSAYSGLNPFIPDPDWVDRAGEEGAVNRELEVVLGSRETGIFLIQARSLNLSCLPSVLEHYLSKFPTNTILLKWLDDSLESCQAVYRAYHKPVSDLPN